MPLKLSQDADKKDLWQEIQRLRRELEKAHDEVEELQRKHEEYKRRHPEMVGVKYDKAYDLRTGKKKRDKRTPTASRPDPEAASGRRPGGQPGHQGHARRRPERVDQFIHVRLDACPDCGGTDFGDAVEWMSRVVEDIPPPATVNTEYAQERRWCRGCGKHVMARAPTALPGARFSLRFMLWILYMHVRLKTSIDDVVAATATTFGARISHGEVVGILRRLADAYGPAYGRLLQDVGSRPARYIDESPWPVNGEAGWVWAFVTKWEVVYVMDPRRTHEVPFEILGTDAVGVDVHDRHSLYDKLAKITGRPQGTCWFHPIADAGELTASKYHPEEAWHVFQVLLGTYHVFDGFDGAATVDEAEAVWDAMQELLDRPYKNAKVRSLARNLATRKEELIRFAHDPEVEGTNNRAERALRIPITARKVRGGSRARWAAGAYGRILSIIRTLELRGLGFVTHGARVLRDGAIRSPALTSHG